MRDYKRTRYDLIAYLLDHQATVSDVLSCKSENLKVTGFEFDSGTKVNLTPELFEFIKKYLQHNNNTVGKYLFPSAKAADIPQSYEGFRTAFQGYLQSIGSPKSLADYGVVSVYKRPAEDVRFNDIESVIAFLREKNIELPKDTDVIPKVQENKHKNNGRPA